MKSAEERVTMFADEARIYAKDVMVVSAEDAVKLIEAYKAITAELLDLLKYIAMHKKRAVGDLMEDIQEAIERAEEWGK